MEPKTRSEREAIASFVLGYRAGQQHKSMEDKMPPAEREAFMQKLCDEFEELKAQWQRERCLEAMQEKLP